MSLSHKTLSAWYLQLSHLLEAGIPLPQAIVTASGPSPRYRDELAEPLNEGQSPADLFDEGVSWLPKTDAQLLRAGSIAGRLSQACLALSERHERLGEDRSRIIMASLYPLLVLHLGILIVPFLSMLDPTKGLAFDGGLYAAKVAIALGPLWAVIFLVAFLIENESPIIYRVVQWMPGLRGYQKNQSLADLAFALKGFVEAGLPIGESWARSGETLHDKSLRSASRALRVVVNQGQLPSEHLFRLGCFPPEFISLYKTGEQTGLLEPNLEALGRNYAAKAGQSMKFVTVFYPMALFLIVGALAASEVIVFYLGYLNQITAY
ncbi:MAG: type II secretion system F family protein [Verrucomicrobiota bacterium]